MLLMISVAMATAQQLPDAASSDDGLRIHKFVSPYQRGETQIRVLLPDHIQPGTQYRCLYVLPVEPLDEHRYGDGLRECRKTDIHNRFQLICVAPTFSDLPWYADHPTDPHLRQELHFLRTIVPYVDQHYPVIREAHGRLLVGFSKSGWGAFSLLLRHPEEFGRAAAWDAPLMMQRPDKYGMQPIFGSQSNFEQYQVSQLLNEFAGLPAGDVRLIHVGYGNFRQHHQQAHALMTQLAVPHVYRDGPQRKHDWHSGWLADVVALLAAPVPRRP